jgi:hypothetical protein
MQRSKATPARLAGLSVLGTLIAAGELVVIVAVKAYWSSHLAGHLWRNLLASDFVLFAVFCSGFYLMIRATKKLSNGIRTGWWTEAELQPVRNFFESRLMRLAPFVLIGIGLVIALIDSSYPHHDFMLSFWICFVLTTGLMQLQRSLINPVVQEPGQQLRASAPLQSKHWGE